MVVERILNDLFGFVYLFCGISEFIFSTLSFEIVGVYICIIDIHAARLDCVIHREIESFNCIVFFSSKSEIKRGSFRRVILVKGMNKKNCKIVDM